RRGCQIGRDLAAGNGRPTCKSRRRKSGQGSKDDRQTNIETRHAYDLRVTGGTCWFDRAGRIRLWGGYERCMPCTSRKVCRFVKTNNNQVVVMVWTSVICAGNQVSEVTRLSAAAHPRWHRLETSAVFPGEQGERAAEPTMPCGTHCPVHSRADSRRWFLRAERQHGRRAG